MIGSFILTAGIIIGLMLAWVLVQTLWRISFYGAHSKEDVLDERRHCDGCSCSLICHKELSELITKQKKHFKNYSKN